MSFDLARALRRIKPQRTADVLGRRPATRLAFVDTAPSAGPELLLDTCVYIDVLQGRTSQAVDDLLQTRIANHSSICLAELTYLFGRLSPAHSGTRSVLREIRQTIADMPGHRLCSPSATAMGEAGMLAGLVGRLSGGDPSASQALLNDAGLYLQALERGCIVLTRNVRDFDHLDQLLPAGRVLFYDRV